MSFHGPFLEAPLANVLFVSGVLFLLVAIYGRIAGPVELDADGRERVAGGVVGVVLVVTGLWLGPIGGTPGATPDTPTPEPEGFRVYEAEITVLVGDESASEYGGVVEKACPYPVQVRGDIAVVGGSGRITYRWITYGPYERTDDGLRRVRRTGPVRSISVDEPGTRHVYLYNGSFGGPNTSSLSQTVNHTLKIIEPNEVAVNRDVELRCR